MWIYPVVLVFWPKVVWALLLQVALQSRLCRFAPSVSRFLVSHEECYSKIRARIKLDIGSALDPSKLNYFNGRKRVIRIRIDNLIAGA
jgi:hypothetical protein